MRSFIKPRKKRLLDRMSALWLSFIILVSIGLIVFGVIIHYKSSFYIKMLDSLQHQNATTSKEVTNLSKKVMLINSQKKIYDEVEKTNDVLKVSMKNLFDLIPDQITLTSVVMERNSLLLKGYSISKEAYTLLLQPPLKSIFTKSEVKFSKMKDAKVEFESFNTIQPQKVEK